MTTVEFNPDYNVSDDSQKILTNIIDAVKPQDWNLIIGNPDYKTQEGQRSLKVSFETNTEHNLEGTIVLSEERVIESIHLSYANKTFDYTITPMRQMYIDNLIQELHKKDEIIDDRSNLTMGDLMDFFDMVQETNEQEHLLEKDYKNPELYKDTDFPIEDCESILNSSEFDAIISSNWFEFQTTAKAYLFRNKLQKTKLFWDNEMDMLTMKQNETTKDYELYVIMKKEVDGEKELPFDLLPYGRQILIVEELMARDTANI